MKLLPFVALLSTAPIMSAASPVKGVAELERRLAEQERQIRQLELENSRLRSVVDGTTTVSETAPSPAAEATGSGFYSVREGDTLSRIARQHGTTPEKLVALNQLKNAELIRPGQKLKVPVVPATGKGSVTSSESLSSETRSHTVRSGETFYSIARTYGLSTTALAEANPGIDPRSLQVGQKLLLTQPGAPSTPSGQELKTAMDSSTEPSWVANKPTVRSVSIDEEITFGEFSTRHRMTPAKLNALNGLNLEPKTVLAKGSELYVSAQP